MLKAIFYSSRKSDDLKVSDIEDLITHSIENNSKKDITGLLIEYKANFLQYLEGPENAVYDLYNKIKKDQRHYDVILVQDLEIEKRIFPKWNMLFKHLEKNSLNEQNQDVYFDHKLIKLMEEKTFGTMLIFGTTLTSLNIYPRSHNYFKEYNKTINSFLNNLLCRQCDGEVLL